MKKITDKDREYLSEILPGIIETIKEAAYYAGRIILDIYESDFSVEYKADNSPLTMADKKANDYIVGVLEKEFPLMSILAEESVDNLDRLKSDWCWIVDPLDGTKEFVKRNGEFTVNIALSFKGKSVLGVVYVPVADEMYWGYSKAGAFYRDECKKLYNAVSIVDEEFELRIEKIHVSKRVEKLIMLHSRSHKTFEIDRLVRINREKIKDIKCAGSSLKGCLIAKGEGDIYYRYGPTMEWDTAAMHCIIEEAGGILMQMDDTEMTYNRRNSLNSKGFYILNSIENKLMME